jgi:uncharacterized protein (TIGR03067 family)
MASQQLDDVDWTRALVVGHSEGGIVAAHLAAANSRATHVAVLAGGGPTQLFDLVELARRRRQPDEDPAAGERRARQVYEGWARVLADPDNADKFWMGHPHRRWSSFLKTSTLEGLLASRAAVFLAHGTADRAVPVASFDVLRAELTTRGRDVTVERLEGYDHGFRKPGEPATEFAGFQQVLDRVTDWFLRKSAALQREAEKEIERLQGTWSAVSMTGDGENQPLEGALAGLQVVVTGDHRAVRIRDTIASRTVFRIDPTARPKTIDVMVLEGALAGQIMLGIYDIEGDLHRVCLSSPGKGRPQEFASKPDSGCTFTTFKRSPEKKPPSASPAPT